MSDVQAASSAADAVDVFQGKTPSFEEFSYYRETGELPERFKPAEQPAETASDDAPEETVASEGEQPEIASESESEEEAQEPPQKGSNAQKRILQLLAEKKELQRKLEAAAKQDVKPESSTAQPTPQADPTEPKVDDFQDYEQYVKALAKWEAGKMFAEYRQRQEQEQAQAQLQAQFEEARQRYEDADDVIIPAVELLAKADKMPPVIKKVIADSKDYVDLVYALGSDPVALEKFISLAEKNPREGLAYVFEVERGVREAISKGKTAEPSGKAPEKKQTQAPKPPVPVTGGNSRGFDVNDESLSAEEWARKRNEQRVRTRGTL